MESYKKRYKKCVNLDYDCNIDNCHLCGAYEEEEKYDSTKYNFHGDSVSVNNGESWEEWTKQNFIDAFGWWCDE